MTIFNFSILIQCFNNSNSGVQRQSLSVYQSLSGVVSDSLRTPSDSLRRLSEIRGSPETIIGCPETTMQRVSRNNSGERPTLNSTTVIVDNILQYKVSINFYLIYVLQLVNNNIITHRVRKLLFKLLVLLKLI